MSHQHSSAVVVAVASSSSGVVGVVAWGQEAVNPSYEHLLPSSHPFALENHCDPDVYK